MKLYHITAAENARAILREGFRDGRGSYGTDREWSGVWLWNAPDADYGVDGDVLLEIEIPDGAAASLADYEWIEDDKPYREWLIPAAILTPLISRMTPACFSDTPARTDH
jgi:hypothetical protein